MQINLSNNLHRIVLVLAFLLVFIGGFYGTLAALMVQWSGTESAGYSHGFLVLLCSLYLLWLKKDDFAAIRPAPFKLALVPLLLCSLVWFVAKVAEIQSLQMLSILGILFFLVPAVFGLAWLKLAFIPLVILLFALPIWQPALPLLQDITTAVTHFNLKLIGRPVYVTGNFVHVSGGSFVIEESCSGLRFLLVAITLSLVNSSMNLHTMRQTLSLLAIAIGLAFVANWVRVLTVILIGDYTRMQSSIVDDHANLGWVIFMILVLVPYFIINRRFPFNVPRRQPTDPAARKTVAAGAVVLGIALMATGPLLIQLSEYRATRNALALTLPDQVAGMTANTSAALAPQDWAPAWLNPTETFFREYGSNPGVELHVVWYAQQSQGAELINVENSIVAPEHWTIAPASTGTYEIADAPAADKVNRLRVVNGRGQQKQVWYWFNVGGEATASEIDAKLLQIQQIFEGRSDASLFAVAVDCAATCDGTDARFERFIRDFSVTIAPQQVATPVRRP